MGHDLHFLERLERVSPEQQQIALALYRDPALVRLVIEGVPEDRDRIAIALDEDDRGPHLIVARDGGFVTCLAAGMRTHDLVVISRAELDANAHWLDHWSEPDDHQRAAVERILKDHFIGGAIPSRAHMRQIERFGGFYYAAIVADISVLLDALAAHERRLLLNVNALRHAQKHRDVVHSSSLTWWDTRAGCAHRLVACGICIERLPPAHLHRVDTTLLHRIAAQCCANMTPMAILRAAWLCGVVGEPMLDHIETRLDEEVELALNPLALVAIACRHPHLCGRIVAIVRDYMSRHSDHTGPGLIAINSYLLSHVELALRHRDASLAQRALIFARHYQPAGPEWAADLMEAPHLSRFHGEALEVMLHTQDQLITKTTHLPPLMMFMPDIAPLDGPDLYPDQPSAHPPQARAALAVQLARRVHAFYHESTVARVEPTPGRNEPCRCGSGKKYKKCCARADDASGD
jgi:hypothetical protein